MSRILIAGGGGFGLEMYGYLTSELSSVKRSGTIVGVLDDYPDCEVVRKFPHVKYFGTIQAYQPKLEDAVIVAFGNVSIRRKTAELLQARGARLLTYIHPTALIANTATISEGAVICPYSVVNSDAHVGKNVVVNVFCSIGHGARVESHSVLSPYSSLSGGSVLGEGGFMGTRATLFPNVVLGANCIVDAHSPAKQSTSDLKIISMRGQYLVLDNRAVPKS